VQLALILNIVPLRIKDVVKRGIVPKNLFQNHEGLQGNKIADFMLNSPENIEKAWDNPETTFENSLIMEVLSLDRIEIFK
tara:strand:+ start:1790 stop:2029 length:240 start_codon:yes stop_codon:yes gene_type:complete